MKAISKWMFIFSLFFSGAAWAEGAAESDSATDWSGDFGFGAGIGVNSLVGANDVSNGRVSNGRVEVGSSESIKTSLWLETHYLFGGYYVAHKCLSDSCLAVNVNETDTKKMNDVNLYKKEQIFVSFKRFRWGPFFAIQLAADDQIINGAALGGMVSLIRTNGKKSDGTLNQTAFNLGLGISSTRYQALANGLSEGDSVSADTQVITNTRNRIGLVLLFSTNIF